MTDTLKALDEIEAALAEANKTLQTASRQLTQDHRMVLNGREWGDKTMTRVYDALALLPTLRAALTQPAAVEDGELRRLMAEATPGPWELLPNGNIRRANGEKAAWKANMDNNEALIVAAVNALPGLMAERERMKEALYQIIDLDHHNMGPESSATKLARAALGDQP